MFYFKKNKDNIEKYLINFDKEKIEELKEKIIDNCSYIEHKEYTSDYGPIFIDEIIRNYKCIFTDEVKEYFEETRDVYLYSYDEYKPPQLVKLIDKLLNNNPDVIDKILNYDFANKISIDDKIKLANQELNEIDSNDIIERKEKLRELEKLMNLKIINKNQHDIKPYYDELLKLIRFELIDLISISELNKIESFFEIKIDNINKCLKKALVK